MLTGAMGAPGAVFDFLLMLEGKCTGTRRPKTIWHYRLRPDTICLDTHH